MSCSHVQSLYFLNKLKLFHSSCSIPQQGYCFSLTNVPKRVKFDPNIKILHHSLFVVYNCFRRDENDTVLKWVERLRRLIFWWLEIWAFPGSLLYRDQIHILVWIVWIANYFEDVTNLESLTAHLVQIGLNNSCCKQHRWAVSWVCLLKKLWLVQLPQNCWTSAQSSHLGNHWSEWRALLSPAGIECSTWNRKWSERWSRRCPVRNSPHQESAGLCGDGLQSSRESPW